MDNPLYPALAASVASLALLAWSMHLRRRHRLLSDLPTSKTHGVFIGFVELKGTAEAESPLRSKLAEQTCVHYRYSVEERWSRVVTETYTDANGKTQTRHRTESGWKTIASGGETIPFYLRDDTGAVLVQPARASIEPRDLFSATVRPGDALYYRKGPPGAVAHSDHVRRFSESGIPLHAPLYVVGQARERADLVAPEIAASADAECFIISTRNEERVVRGYGVGSWVTWLLGALCAGTAGLAAQNAFALADPVVPVSAALALYLLWWGGTWIWMVYNSLVGLRERVRQGWSLVEVQLKRRHDLIPNLVATLSAYSSHEQTLQTALAALRTQAAATAPGAAGPDFHGLAASLRAVVERYPELQAQAGFAHLQKTLVETEQRIALARTYYNDLATYLATRLERVPDCFVARLGRMQPALLLAAADFERAPVEVNFSTNE
ncbi:MAG: LemA domain-containing protein [Opitutus sp.]|nr:LemA domain-containing protein [Opitutus sp.]